MLHWSAVTFPVVMGSTLVTSVGLVSPKWATSSGPEMPSGGCAFSTACRYDRGGGKGAGVELMVKRYR